MPLRTGNGANGARRTVSPRSQGFDLSGGHTPLGQLARDTWASRELIRMLARKNFFVRYRRASLGLLWSVGLPVFQTAVLAVVFSRVVRIGVGGDYVPFLFSGMLGWTFVSQTIGNNATAIVDGTFMSNRIYFPRSVHVLSGIAVSLYTFWISAAIVLVICLAYGVSLGPEVLLVVPAVVLMVVFVAGVTLFSSAIHVYFRDIRFVVTALLSAWFYVTPVIYPLDIVPEGLEWVVKANPATGIVLLFRAATVGAESGWLSAVWISCAWAAAFFAAAVLLHRRFDRVFVDLL